MCHSYILTSAWLKTQGAPLLRCQSASILEIYVGHYSRCIPSQAKWITNKVEDKYSYYCRYREKKYFRIDKKWQCCQCQGVVR